MGLRVNVHSAKILTDQVKIKCFQNLSQSISGSSSQLHMVFCHFELHLNVATSSNSIQYSRHKDKLQKVSKKTPQLHMNPSTCCCHSAQTQEVFPMETNFNLNNSYLLHNIKRKPSQSSTLCKEIISKSEVTKRHTSVYTRNLQ